MLPRATHTELECGENSAERRALRELLPAMDEEVRAYLRARMSKLMLLKNDILFRKGDPSDALYLVIQGRLAGIAEAQDDETIIIGTMGSGETVGENGLISGIPRSLTIKALTDCTLLQLDEDRFAEISRNCPSILLEITKLVVHRNNQVLRKLTSEVQRPWKVALVRTADSSVVDIFLEKLVVKVTSVPNMKVVASKEIDAQYQNDSGFLDVLEKMNSFLSCFVYSTILSDQRLTQFYEGYFDAVVWLVDARSSPETARRQWEDQFQRAFSYNPRRELLLVHKPGVSRRAGSWSRADTFDLIHHVTIDDERDYDRILRFFRGKAVGVVLSGGGTRGLFHIGALRALQEMQVPIDAIGGVSAGAVAAASYAISPHYADYSGKVHDIVACNEHHLAWRNFTFPITSFFNTTNVTESIRTIFGSLQVEDLHIPLFCVTCNLNQSKETVWQHGELWKAIRASVAIPGIVTPTNEEGDIHVDGGVVNNLPIDVMRRILPSRSRVIAVDVTDDSIDVNNYHFPMSLGFFDSLFIACRLKRHPYRFPNFYETVLKALLVGGLERVAKNRSEADLLIRPNLQGISPVDIARCRPLMESGYKETLQFLKALPRADIAPDCLHG